MYIHWRGGWYSLYGQEDPVCYSSNGRFRWLVAASEGSQMITQNVTLFTLRKIDCKGRWVYVRKVHIWMHSDVFPHHHNRHSFIARKNDGYFLFPIHLYWFSELKFRSRFCEFWVIFGAARVTVWSVTFLVFNIFNKSTAIRQISIRRCCLHLKLN